MASVMSRKPSLDDMKKTEDPEAPMSQILTAEVIPEIDPELERRTSRKFDIFLLPQIAILIICAYLDRTNIGKSWPLKYVAEALRI